MPTYGYQCKDCGHRFEVFQKMSDPALTACESCGGAVKKVLYPIGISFKGSGFYVNDYAKPAPAASSAKADDGAAAPEAPADKPAIGDAKPATETKAEAAPSLPAAETAPTGKS